MIVVTRSEQRLTRVRRCDVHYLQPLQPDSVSPARRKNRHIAATRTIVAVRNKAKYDPIGAGDKQQEEEKRRSQLSKDYKIHQLRELAKPIFCELEDGSSDLGDL